MLDDQLQGLLLPPEPISPFLLLGLGLVLILIVVLLWYSWRKHNTPRAIAKRQLLRLQQAVEAGEVDRKIAGLAVVKYLCQGLVVTRLDTYQAVNIDRWQHFLVNLNKACYAQKGEGSELTRLISEAMDWLDSDYGNSRLISALIIMRLP